MLRAPWLGGIQLALQLHRLDRATDLLESALTTVPVRPLLLVKLHVRKHWLSTGKGIRGLASQNFSVRAKQHALAAATERCSTKAGYWIRCRAWRSIAPSPSVWPRFGGLCGSLWPASMEKSSSQQSSANCACLTTAGSAYSRVSGKTMHAA